MQAALAMGVPLADIESARAARKPPPLDIWPDNWRPLMVAMAMHTQWRVGPGGPIGWDYTALPVVESRIGGDPGDPADEFSAMQVIEGEMLRIIMTEKKH